MVYGVILAGGKGERFWPLSRASKPKQFLKLTSDKTMLEETILRVKPFIPMENIRIVAGESMGQLILSSAGNVDSEHLLIEPCPRNTCLAIGLAAAHLVGRDPHAVMAVLSADHLIRSAERLRHLLEDGSAIASAEDKLITIGIVPTRPETGYGYIKLGDEYKTEKDSLVYNVSGFTEKPKAVVAQEYYYSRRYLWNSGMFVWSARTLLKAIESCQPEMAALIEDYSSAIDTPREKKAREKLYQKAASISVDYAVLENADNVLAIKADIVWDDVGSWSALERYKDRDSDNNVLVGEAVTLDSYETTIYNDATGMVAALGISDLVVVRSGDITLVAHKAKLDKIKDLLAQIEENEKFRHYL